MTTTPNVFKYQGAEFSSQLPNISMTIAAGTPGARSFSTPRGQFHTALINQKISELYPENASLPNPPVYIATGGGYGSYETLIDVAKQQGVIDPHIPLIAGCCFQDRKELLNERALVAQAVRQHLNPQSPESVTKEEVEHILSSFYSDEVNTKLAKAAILRCFNEGKSVIHRSASIYPDTIERAQAAKAKGFKTVLIAGTQDVEHALKTSNHSVEPFNTVTSYQKFAERFERELLPLFDEVKLYDTINTPPVLLMEKRAAKPGELSGETIIHRPLDYMYFLAQKSLNPKDYASPHAEKNAIAMQHATGKYPVPEPVKAVAAGVGR